MPNDLTATLVPEQPLPHVLVQLLDVTADATVTITRTPEGDTPGGVVRGTPVDVDAGGVLLATDVEYPLGADLTYRASVVDRASGVELDAPTVTVPAPDVPVAGMVVSSPVSGVAVPCAVVDESDAQRRWRGAQIERAGYPVPLFITTPHGSWSWELRLLTATVDQHDELTDLLGAGLPVLLRLATPGCALRTGWAQPLDLSSDRVSVPASDPRRYVTVRLHEVDPVDSRVEAQTRTLLDLHEYEPTTLTQLATRAPTLLQLAVNVALEVSSA